MSVIPSFNHGMRHAEYSAKKVYLPNASRIGFDTCWAKPGSWITFDQAGGQASHGRVLGRIDHSSRDGLEVCDGFLAVMVLGVDLSHAFVRWVDPATVNRCTDKPPAALLAWISGDDWAKRKADIPRYIAMSQFGTCSESYIESRNDPAKPYNKPQAE